MGESHASYPPGARRCSRRCGRGLHAWMSRSAWLALAPHHQQQVRATHPRTTGMLPALRGHPEARGPPRRGTAYLAPGTPTSARPEVPASLLRPILAPPPARVRTLRPVLPSLSPRSHQEGGSILRSPSPRPPPAAPIGRGSPGCAHLTSGARGSRPRRRAPRLRSGPPGPALRRPKHPALAVSNGLFQQLGAELTAGRQQRAHPAAAAHLGPRGEPCFMAVRFDSTC